MSLETKALSDFQNVISCEMDLQDALAGGSLDGYAIRDTNLSRTSFESSKTSSSTVLLCLVCAWIRWMPTPFSARHVICADAPCAMPTSTDGICSTATPSNAASKILSYKTGTSSNPIWSTVISIAQKSLKHSSNRIICMALRSKTPSSHKSNSPTPKWAMPSFRAPTSRAP